MNVHLVLFAAGLVAFYLAMRDMPAPVITIPACKLRLQDPHAPQRVAL